MDVVVHPLQISIDFRTRLTSAYKQLAKLQMASSALKHEVFQLHKRYIEMSKDQEPRGVNETYQQLIESQRVPEQPSQFYELITLNEDSLQACPRDEKIKLIQSYQYMLENINRYISCEV